MTKIEAEKVYNITLTEERPVRVKNGLWPVVAKASHDRDHNNQEIFRRHYLRVRQHDTGADLDRLIPHPDGQCLVYGWYESSYQGEHGAQAGYRCDLADVVETIRTVGEAIDAPQWLIDQCVGDLPTVDLTDEPTIVLPPAYSPEELCNRWITEEQQYRSQVAEAREKGTPYSAMMAHADQLAACRRQLQEAAQLVSVVS